MLEGFDREVELTCPAWEAMDQAIRILRLHWPEAVLRQSGEEGAPRPLATLALPLPRGATSLFVDKTAEVASKIAAEGVLPELAPQTLWVFLEGDHLCFALDEEGSELDAIVRDISQAVSPPMRFHYAKAA